MESRVCVEILHQSIKETQREQGLKAGDVPQLDCVSSHMLKQRDEGKFIFCQWIYTLPPTVTTAFIPLMRWQKALVER